MSIIGGLNNNKGTKVSYGVILVIGIFVIFSFVVLGGNRILQLPIRDFSGVDHIHVVASPLISVSDGEHVFVRTSEEFKDNYSEISLTSLKLNVYALEVYIYGAGDSLIGTTFGSIIIPVEISPVMRIVAIALFMIVFLIFLYKKPKIELLVLRTAMVGSFIMLCMMLIVVKIGITPTYSSDTSFDVGDVNSLQFDELVVDMEEDIQEPISEPVESTDIVEEVTEEASEEVELDKEVKQDEPVESTEIVSDVVEEVTEEASEEVEQDLTAESDEDWLSEISFEQDELGVCLDTVLEMWQKTDAVDEELSLVGKLQNHVDNLTAFLLKGMLMVDVLDVNGKTSKLEKKIEKVLATESDDITENVEESDKKVSKQSEEEKSEENSTGTGFSEKDVEVSEQIIEAEEANELTGSGYVVEDAEEDELTGSGYAAEIVEEVEEEKSEENSTGTGFSEKDVEVSEQIIEAEETNELTGSGYVVEDAEEDVFDVDDFLAGYDGPEEFLRGLFGLENLDDCAAVFNAVNERSDYGEFVGWLNSFLEMVSSDEDIKEDDMEDVEVSILDVNILPNPVFLDSQLSVDYIQLDNDVDGVNFEYQWQKKNVDEDSYAANFSNKKMFESLELNGSDYFYDPEKIDIGFSFDFYGQTYNELYLSKQGFASFSEIPDGYVADSEIDMPIIAPFLVYEDIFNSRETYIEVQTIGSEGEREVVVQWHFVTGDLCEEFLMQLHLYEKDDSISFHYEKSFDFVKSYGVFVGLKYGDRFEFVIDGDKVINSFRSIVITRESGFEFEDIVGQQSSVLTEVLACDWDYRAVLTPYGDHIHGDTFHTASVTPLCEDSGVDEPISEDDVAWYDLSAVQFRTYPDGERVAVRGYDQVLGISLVDEIGLEVFSGTKSFYLTVGSFIGRNNAENTIGVENVSLYIGEDEIVGTIDGDNKYFQFDPQLAMTAYNENEIVSLRILFDSNRGQDIYDINISYGIVENVQ